MASDIYVLFKEAFSTSNFLKNLLQYGLQILFIFFPYLVV